MATTISTLDFDDFQALSRMTARSEPFVATIAKATLAIVEARRDAEMRAAISELALDAAQERFAAIRAVIASASDNGLEPAEALHRSRLWPPRTSVGCMTLVLRNIDSQSRTDA